MVTSEDLVLDEVILQIFEEQDEAFHFPVTSQKDARAFVKALNKKGVSYDSMSHEIKEREQSFGAWRTGISRPGIGNRIIERINRPLQEVLLSEGEDASICCDQLSECSDDAAEGVNANHNDSYHVKESQLTTESKSADNEKSTLNFDGKGVHKKDNKSGDQPKHIMKNINGNKRSIEKISAGQGGQGVLRETVKDVNLRTEKISSVAANGGNDHAAKKSAEVASQRSESALIESAKPVTKLSEMKHPRDLKPVKAKKPDLRNLPKETTNSVNIKEREGLKERGDSLRHKTKDTECDLTHIAADSVNTIRHEDAASRDKNASEDKVLQEKASKVQSESSSVVNQVTAEDPELLNRSQMTDNTTVQTRNVDAEIAKSKPVPPSCCSLTGEATILSGNIRSGDVLENYSSDLDGEFIDDDITGVSTMENETVKETTKEPRSHDFGYIYVFTDSSSEVAEFRVKVGASRFPHKKLKQARLFNIDMKLVSAVKVSHRQKAAAAVEQQLKEFAIPDTIGWFRGPLDKILKVLMATTKDHPVQD